jgi:anti-sigma B factor antagonist
MQLIADREMRKDAVVVRFEGEVDMAVADEFVSHLNAGLDAASVDRPLIIDLDAVSFFGSSALNDVQRCHDEGARNGIAVRLVTNSHIVIRVIQATGLDEILAVYPTIDDALGVTGGVKSA